MAVAWRDTLRQRLRGARSANDKHAEIAAGEQQHRAQERGDPPHTVQSHGPSGESSPADSRRRVFRPSGRMAHGSCPPPDTRMASRRVRIRHSVRARGVASANDRAVRCVQGVHHRNVNPSSTLRRHASKTSAGMDERSGGCAFASRRARLACTDAHPPLVSQGPAARRQHGAGRGGPRCGRRRRGVLRRRTGAPHAATTSPRRACASCSTPSRTSTGRFASAARTWRSTTGTRRRR